MNGQSPTSERTITLISDNQPDLDMLVTILTESGYTVTPSLDSSSVLAEAWAELPNLILLDANLAQIDGYAVCRQLKTDKRIANIPVIFIYNSRDNNKADVFSAGGVDYITKPFQTEEILAKVETHLSLHNIRQRLEAQDTRLQQEITKCKRIEAEFQQYRTQLDKLVEVRTAELRETNEQLLQEIAGLRQAEEALQLTRFTVERVADAMFWMDSKAQIIDVNKAACDVLGYTRQELVNLSLFDIDPVFTAERWRTAWKQLKEMGTLTRETHHRTKDGRIFPVEISANFIEFGGRELDCAFARNISERKQAEEVLSLTRFMVEHMSDALYWIDSNAHIVDVNEAACRMLGYTRAEFVQMSVLDIDPAPPFNRADFRKRLRQKGTVTFETQHRTKDGRLVPVEIVANFIKFNNQEFNCSFARDIIERKQAEAALKEYSERLEEMVKERTEELREAQEQLVRREKLAVLGELAGGVAHELRNPFGVIANAVYFLQMISKDADDVTREYLDIIEMRLQDAIKIVNDLLNFARSSPAQRETISVQALINEVLARYPPPEGITIIKNFTLELPPVLVDPQQIGQVLANLVTNAYQAMPDGGQLTFEAQAATGLLRLSIIDTGTGMPPEILAKIFEPLFSTKIHGIGLGLSVAKNLAEVNGGSLEVISIVGQGTTFHFTLPQKGVMNE